MPEKGGKAGHYATAYLYLLDGIAHVGAVSLYRNESFYNDAFERLRPRARAGEPGRRRPADPGLPALVRLARAGSPASRRGRRSRSSRRGSRRS